MLFWSQSEGDSTIGFERFIDNANVFNSNNDDTDNISTQEDCQCILFGALIVFALNRFHF